MVLALPRQKLEREVKRPPDVLGASPGACQGEAGTSRGVNILPGSEDDGWVVPPPARLSDGTYVQLYKDGEALHAGFEAIRAARQRVCLESYIFADDDTGRAFAELLAAKAREGVSVYLIYDSFGSFGLTHLWRKKPSMFRQMAQAGVRLQEFHPFRPWETTFSWRPANRDHRKLLVVDDDIAGLGGLNVGGEYAGSWVAPSALAECDLWRDNAVGIRGPSARLFLKTFWNTWQYTRHGGRIRRAEFIHNLDGSAFPDPAEHGPTDPALGAGAPELGVLASVPTMNSPLRPFLGRLMRSARESLYLTMAYFAPDDPLIDEMCAAARRGVRVRLMVPGRSDVQLLTIAARSFYETLMDAGVEVYERQSVVLHAKTMVVDARVSILGSTNLDYRSIEYNCELSAIIRDPRLGAQMHELFENDVRYASRIELAEWRRRPRWDRFVQGVVSRARYLL